METKRRLPSWMANKASEALNPDTNNVKTKEELNDVAESVKPKAKSLIRKPKKEVTIPSDGNTSFLVKCDTKRKKKGFVEKDDNHDQEIILEKRKRGRISRKDERPSLLSTIKEVKEIELEINNENEGPSKSYEFDINNKNQDPLCDEEDDDYALTMDDLLSIAKEIVANEDKYMDEEDPSERECKLKSKLSDNSSSVTITSVAKDTKREDYLSERECKLKSKSSSVTITSDGKDTKREEEKYSVEVEDSRSTVTLADYKTTGDPAQDMLDLFLGPLLNKPIVKEEKTSIRNAVIPHEVKKQQHDDVISKKPVTFTKKKNSLRDTVAMLLE